MILLIGTWDHDVVKEDIFFLRNLSSECFVLFKFTQNICWVGIQYTIITSFRTQKRVFNLFYKSSHGVVSLFIYIIHFFFIFFFYSVKFKLLWRFYSEHVFPASRAKVPTWICGFMPTKNIKCVLRVYPQRFIVPTIIVESRHLERL